MKITKFEQGQKVVMIVNNKMKIGTIVNLYTQLQNPIAIVDFNGDCVKVPVEKIAPYEEPNEKEPVEKKEITITSAEFLDIASGIVADQTEKGDPKIIVMGIYLASKLYKALFIGDVDNKD
jgi:hypothetical protein|nr:MAG TPA: hypothetical protein [Caudoviricetes sp.]